MEIFFADPEDTPVPPNEVRIREFSARPYRDGRRVRIYLEITPFQQRPDAEVDISDDQGQRVASVSVIETIDPKMEMTMHLPPSRPQGRYTVHAMVFYRQEEGEELTGKGRMEETPGNDILVADQAETTFELS